MTNGKRIENFTSLALTSHQRLQNTWFNFLWFDQLLAISIPHITESTNYFGFNSQPGPSESREFML